MEQEPDIGVSRCPSSIQDPGANQDWRTLSVEQSRITDYYPAARPTDWPIQDNLAEGCIPTPSQTENVISIDETTEENDQQDVTIIGGGIIRDNDQDVPVSVNTEQSTEETLLNKLSTTPSVVGNTEPAIESQPQGTQSWLLREIMGQKNVLSKGVANAI